jgi:hypothetical protein
LLNGILLPAREKENLHMMVMQQEGLARGAWVTPEKRKRSQHELLVTNQDQSGARQLKITAPDLARTLKANNLEMVADVKRCRVVRKA